MGQTKHILTGRCLCGSIRYETAAPVSPPAFCHCESCRRATGAHVVAWMTVDRQALRWLGHEPRWHASSPGVVRGFCTGCGTPLTYRGKSGRQYVAAVTTGGFWGEVAGADEVTAFALP